MEGKEYDFEPNKFKPSALFEAMANAIRPLDIKDIGLPITRPELIFAEWISVHPLKWQYDPKTSSWWSPHKSADKTTTELIEEYKNSS